MGFLGGPVVEISLPVQGVGEPQGQKTEMQSKSNIVTDSIKTLKIVHIKKDRGERS